ncbi:MAG: hypothetical protein H0X47_14290 [Nitrospirales bacterium]|nr:hypothetical protein [Nitrospirales bacterium]
MMNQPLLDLYKKHEPTIVAVKSRCQEEMEGPFLTAPNDDYWRSPKKVAFVGQETNGWTSETDIYAQMANYTHFNLGKEYYSSPFWNIIRKFEAALTGSTFSSAWLNLNRFDEGGGRPSRENQRILTELDFLLLEELTLINPAVVIFFTGPDYDHRITKLLEATQLEIENFPPRQLCRLRSPVLPSVIFRTYHPKYLRFSRLEQPVIEAIIALAEHG